MTLALAFDVSAAWKNGPDGDAQADIQAECSDPPYSTHDWAADHAGDLLPDNEKAWLEPHRSLNHEPGFHIKSDGKLSEG